MRASIAFIAVALSTLVVAQNPPPCALACIAKADPGSCQPTDNACLCKNKPFIDATTACITQTCTNPADLAAAEAGAQALCASAGVTLSAPAATPVPSAPASSGGAASSGGSPSSPAGTAKPSSTAPPASSAGGSSPAASSPAASSPAAALANVAVPYAGLGGALLAALFAL